MTCPKNSLCPPPHPAEEWYTTTNNYLQLIYGDTGETYSLSEFNISPFSQPDGEEFSAVVVFMNTISNHYVFQPYFDINPEDTISEFFNQASLSLKFPGQSEIVQQFFTIYNPSTMSTYTQYEPTTDQWELFLLGDTYLEFDSTSLKYYECPGVCPPPQEYKFGDGQGRSVYQYFTVTTVDPVVGIGIKNFSVQGNMVFCIVRQDGEGGKMIPFKIDGTVTSEDFLLTSWSSTEGFNYTSLTQDQLGPIQTDLPSRYNYHDDFYDNHQYQQLTVSSLPLEAGTFYVYMYYNGPLPAQLKVGDIPPEFDVLYLTDSVPPPPPPPPPPPSEENSNSLSLLSIILIILGLYYISTMVSSRRS